MLEFLTQLSAKDQLVVILCAIGLALNFIGLLIIVVFGEKLGPMGAMVANLLMVQLGWVLCATSSIIAIFF